MDQGVWDRRAVEDAANKMSTSTSRSATRRVCSSWEPPCSPPGDLGSRLSWDVSWQERGRAGGSVKGTGQRVMESPFLRTAGQSDHRDCPQGRMWGASVGSYIQAWSTEPRPKAAESEALRVPERGDVQIAGESTTWSMWEGQLQERGACVDLGHWTIVQDYSSCLKAKT